MSSKIWTISNCLSLSRFVLVIPVAFFLFLDTPGSRFIAFVITVVGATTDFLDGYFARKFSQVSDLGRILDPLADKFSIGILVFVLTIQGDFPLWFLVAVLVRDIIIFFGGMYFNKTQRVILQSNWLGKWTAGLLAILILVSMLKLPEFEILKILLITGGTVMLVLSLFSYTKRFLEVINANK